MCCCPKDGIVAQHTLVMHPSCCLYYQECSLPCTVVPALDGMEPPFRLLSPTSQEGLFFTCSNGSDTHQTYVVHQRCWHSDQGVVFTDCHHRETFSPSVPGPSSALSLITTTYPWSRCHVMFLRCCYEDPKACAPISGWTRT